MLLGLTVQQKLNILSQDFKCSKVFLFKKIYRIIILSCLNDQFTLIIKVIDIKALCMINEEYSF